MFCWETSGSGFHLDAIWRAPPTRTRLKIQSTPLCAQRHSGDRDKELPVSTCPSNFSDPFFPIVHSRDIPEQVRSIGALPHDLQDSEDPLPASQCQTLQDEPRQVRAESDPWWGLHWSDSFPAQLDQIRIWGIWRPGRRLELFVFFLWSIRRSLWDVLVSAAVFHSVVSSSIHMNARTQRFPTAAINVPHFTSCFGWWVYNLRVYLQKRTQNLFFMYFSKLCLFVQSSENHCKLILVYSRCYLVILYN